MKKLNSYEDCEKRVFLTWIVKYAKGLFLKIYIQFIFFAQHDIFEYLVYISSKAGEFWDKQYFHIVGKAIF